MNRLFIIFYSAFIGLLLISCNHSSQKGGTKGDYSGIVAEKAVEKETTAVKCVINTAAEIYSKPQVPVLCYHRIENGRKGEYAVSPAAFAAHMKVLADSGYHSISPDQLYDYLVKNKKLPDKPVMITFDDSRVEHYEIAAPVMEKYGFRGVFFIMTITYNKKNYMTKEQIAQLARSGYTVGLHSWDHTMVTKYKDSDWQKQMVNPKKELERIIGKPVEYWAYPNGVYNHTAAEELSKYFKLSFILISKRDSIKPLQTIRRMIVPKWTPQTLLKSIHETFGKKK